MASPNLVLVLADNHFATEGLVQQLRAGDVIRKVDFLNVAKFDALWNALDAGGIGVDYDVATPTVEAAVAEVEFMRARGADVDEGACSAILYRATGGSPFPP